MLETKFVANATSEPLCDGLRNTRNSRKRIGWAELMIVFNDVCLTLSSGNLRTTVLADASFTLPTNERFVVLGHEGCGKTTLIRLLSGLHQPTSGTISRYANVSFPIGFMGGFKRKLTAYENIVHTADMYGADVDEVVNFVALVTSLGSAMKEEFGDLPPKHRLRLAFAVCYAIPFDVYLFDNKIAAGDDDFRSKCERMFEARAEKSGIIMTTSVPRYARRYGRRGAILHNGRIFLYDDLEGAIRDFERIEKGMGVDHSFATELSGQDDESG